MKRFVDMRCDAGRDPDSPECQECERRKMTKGQGDMELGKYSEIRKDLDTYSMNGVLTKRQMMILNEVGHERIKQDTQWGVQNHDHFRWYPILGEEFGEIGSALCAFINNTHPDQAIKDNLRYEIIQLMAVGLAWIECMERNE